MNESEEKAYMQGHAMACAAIIMHAVRDLRADDLEDFNVVARMGALEAERALAIAQLRGLCAVYGDNDWPDNLHLADIIEKHLARPMDRRGR